VCAGPPIPPLPAAEVRADEDPRALHPGEEHCALTGRWLIVQRIAAHRYSTDDVMTAWAAWRAAARLVPPQSRPLRCCDIGCGIGSVLLMTAWLHPTATCVGVEAQAVRAATAARSIAVNGVTARVSVRHGDLRDPATVPDAELASMGGGFDLVTGTPPYFEVTAASALPADEESSRCLFEYRGGIEAYSAAAVRLMHPAHGVFVVCESALAIDRGYAAAAAAGLRVVARVDCVSKAGKEPLFIVFVMVRAPPADSSAAGGAPTDASEATRHAAATLASPALAGDAFTPHGVSPYGPVAAAPDAGDGVHGDADGASVASTSDADESGGDAGGAGAGGVGEVAPVAASAVGAKRQRMGPAAAARRAARLARVFGARGAEAVATITVRDAAGRHTAEYVKLLAEMGKPG
jgi:tRNA1Val (adenine37-N6)-methyltransferase